jgi:putative Mn2+ efflux pump MntP
LGLPLQQQEAAVSMTAAASGFATKPRAIFRLAFSFGLFQAVMPVFGWLLGSAVVDYISAWDHWVAFTLLALVGVNMIRSGLDANEERMSTDPSRGLTLITLSIATSIDALAVGLSFCVLDMKILIPCILIGVITFVMSVGAVKIGTIAGEVVGKRVEILGGVILIGIGLNILFGHMT